MPDLRRMRRVVVCDVGGTHARFAIASLDDGRVADLSEPVTLRTGEHASFEAAREEFGRRQGEALPPQLGIAFAGPVDGNVLKLTNSAWTIRPSQLAAQLGIGVGDTVTLLSPEGGGTAFGSAPLEKAYTVGAVVTTSRPL